MGRKKVFKKNIKIFCSLGYYVDITNRLINNIKYNIMKTKEFIVEKIIALLNEIDVDGETMEYIVNEVGMSDQLFKQSIVCMSEKDLGVMLDERQTALNSINNKYHFISSHGDLYIDKDGNVLPQSDLSDWLLEIGKVDVEELIHYLQLNGFDGLDDGDVLDFGYWDKNGEYHKPNIEYRKDNFHNQDFRYTQIDEVITKTEEWLNKYRTI